MSFFDKINNYMIVNVIDARSPFGEDGVGLGLSHQL